MVAITLINVANIKFCLLSRFQKIKNLLALFRLIKLIILVEIATIYVAIGIHFEDIVIQCKYGQSLDLKYFM